MIIAADFLAADKIGLNGLVPIENVTVDGKKFPFDSEEKLLRLEKYKPAAVSLVQYIDLDSVKAYFK